MLNDLHPVLDDSKVILTHEGKPSFVSSLSLQMWVYLGSSRVIMSLWGHDWKRTPGHTSDYTNWAQEVDPSDAASCALEPFLLFNTV